MSVVKNILISHGGFIVDGKMIGIAFIGASISDGYGNLRGTGGKTDCGVPRNCIVRGAPENGCASRRGRGAVPAKPGGQRTVDRTCRLPVFSRW